jgi:ABC-type lipoprotein release transport system permease subunit
LSGLNKMRFSAPYSHWVRSALLFLIRSGRSTSTLSIMVVAAVASLIFLSSLAVGVNDAMIRNSAGLFSGHVSASGLPSSLKPEDLSAKGVKFILRRVYLPGGLFQGANNETITMIGVDADRERDAAAWPHKIIKGRFIRNNRAELLLSSAMSEKLKAGVGDVLNFSVAGSGTSTELKVAGIYRTGMAQLDLDVAFCSFESLPFTPPVWSASIFLDERVKPETVVSRYNKLFDRRYAFVTWKDSMPDLVQLINLNYVSMTIVIVLVFAVVALGISCAFVVFIFRNLREYGIMKAMGVTSGEVAFLIIAEVVLINIFACLIGGLIGVLVVVLFSKTGIDLTAWTSHNQYFAVSGIIFPRMTAYSLTGPPVVSIFFGLVSAIWPALLIARKRAADVLRVI